MTAEQYYVRGCTALLDAVGGAGDQVVAGALPQSLLLCIQLDTQMAAYVPLREELQHPQQHRHGHVVGQVRHQLVG